MFLEQPKDEYNDVTWILITDKKEHKTQTFFFCKTPTVTDRGLQATVCRIKKRENIINNSNKAICKIIMPNIR